MTGTLVKINANGRWPLWLLPHRAARTEWETGWEVERLDDMADRLEPGMRLWDVGAEEGEFGILAATWGCEVGLIEPNPLVWPNIAAAWNANVDRPPLFCFVGFAADETNRRAGDGYSVEWPDCAHNEIIADHGFCRPEERPDLAAIKLDDLVARGLDPPDALTIDVEGSELLVLSGARTILTEHRPVVWVSVHPEMMFDYYRQYTVDLFNFMGPLGYAADLLGFDHEFHFRWSPL